MSEGLFAKRESIVRDLRGSGAFWEEAAADLIEAQAEEIEQLRAALEVERSTNEE